MSNILLVVAFVALAWIVFSYVQRNRRQLVPSRGTSVGADLGALSDQPRVTVASVITVGPDLVRVVFRPEGSVAGGAGGAGDAGGGEAGGDLEVVVSLSEDEFGFEQLHEWKRSGRPIAIVMPPDSRIVRLRSIDDLQPLTLRRADEGVGGA